MKNKGIIKWTESFEKQDEDYRMTWVVGCEECYLVWSNENLKTRISINN